MPENPFQSLKTRLNLSTAQFAAYLGVPLPTCAKWLRGEREAPAVARRLLDVLQLVEMTCPDVHNHLIGGAK